MIKRSTPVAANLRAMVGHAVESPRCDPQENEMFQQIITLAQSGVLNASEIMSEEMMPEFVGTPFHGDRMP